MLFLSLDTVVKVPTKMYLRFDRNFCNSTRYASYDVEKIFGSRHLSFQTLSDLSCLVLPNPAYRAILKELGFVVDRGDHLIRGQIARILLTPNAELTYFIRQNLKAFDTEHVIGVQVRTGGWLASTFEYGSFLRRTAVMNIGSYVLAEMEKRHWNQTNCKVFLTSDSNTAVRMITASLNGKASIIIPSGYKAGHSSAYMDYKNHYKHLYRAIMDLVLLSQTHPVFWTEGSSYGLLAARLSLGEAYPLRNSSVCNKHAKQQKQITRACSSSLLRLQGSVSGSSRTSQTEEHTRSEETDQQNNAHNNDNDKSVARLLTEDGDEHLHLGVSNNVTGNHRVSSTLLDLRGGSIQSTILRVDMNTLRERVTNIISIELILALSTLAGSKDLRHLLVHLEHHIRLRISEISGSKRHTRHLVVGPHIVDTGQLPLVGRVIQVSTGRITSSSLLGADAPLFAHLLSNYISKTINTFYFPRK